MIKLLNTLVLLVFLLLGDCSPDPSPDLSCNGRIKAKDLNGIKSCLQTSWRMHYSKSSTGTKKTLPNSFINIKANDSIYYVLEGNIMAEAHIEWVSSPIPSITFTNWKGNEFLWIVDGVNSDTLTLVENNIRYSLTKAVYKPTLNCSGKLRDKALNQIRNCIYGRWQMHYFEGGYSGNERQNLTNSFVHFKPLDSIYFIYEGVLIVKDKLQWQRTNDLSESTYIMIFRTFKDFPFEWGVHQIVDDTLRLYDYGPDKYGYYLTKQN